LPAMLLNEKYPGNNPVKNWFQDRKHPEDITTAIEQIRNSSVVEECYQAAKTYCEIACRELHQLPSSPSRQALTDLADFVVMRRK
jgi:geranylgeranyl pyrophosphate synthase